MERRPASPFGKALRKHLVDRDMNEAQLSAAVGCSKTYTSQVVLGDYPPSERWLALVEDVLKLSPKERQALKNASRLRVSL